MSDASVERSALAEKLEVLRTKASMRSVDVTDILGTTSETVSKWNNGRSYPRPGDESLLVDLENVVECLSEFYRDPRTARAWLYSRHRYFEGLRPTDLIRQGRMEEVLQAIRSMDDPAYT